MSIQHAEIFARLAAPFRDGPDGEVRVRPGQGQGGGQAYVKVQTVMIRLDEVLGPSGWWDDYRLIDDVTVECILTIRLPDGSTLTKRDVGIRAGKPSEGGRIDPGCSWKAAYSDALKRSASKFGVGRYLARCGIADLSGPTGQSMMPKSHTGSDTVGNTNANGHASSPSPSPSPSPSRDRLPSQARPPTPPEPREGGGGGGGGRGNHPPRSGSALYRWAKDQEEAHGAGLIKYLTGWASLQEFPGLMKEWTAVQVGEAHAEALRKLATLADAA